MNPRKKRKNEAKKKNEWPRSLLVKLALFITNLVEITEKKMGFWIRKRIKEEEEEAEEEESRKETEENTQRKKVCFGFWF